VADVEMGLELDGKKIVKYRATGEDLF